MWAFWLNLENLIDWTDQAAVQMLLLSEPNYLHKWQIPIAPINLHSRKLQVGSKAARTVEQQECGSLRTVHIILKN